MKYIEAYNAAIEEMKDYHFVAHPDKSFDYFLFEHNMKLNGLQDKVNEFLNRLDYLKFYKAPKNKDDFKCVHCPENIKMLWGAVKIACFIIAINELNYKDLIYHGINLSLGDLFGLYGEFRDILPMLNEHLQSIVLDLHPDSVKEIQTGDKYKFFRASKSEQALDGGVSPSFVKRPLTFT